MKYSLMTSTAAAAVLIFSPAAHAEGTLRVFGGANFLDLDESFSAAFSGYITSYSYNSSLSRYTYFTTGLSGSAALDLDSKTGYVLGAAVGNDFGNGFGVELELAWRSNEFKVKGAAAGSLFYYSFFYTSISSSPSSLTSTSTPFSTGLSGDGEFNALSLMANAWYELDTGSNLKPFIRGGVGVAWLDFSADAANTGTLLVDARAAVDEDELGFAWQAGAGVNYEISENNAISLEYRYIDAGNVKIEGAKIDYAAQSVMLGFKTRF